MKLVKDFGVTALIGVIVLLGVIGLLAYGVYLGQITIKEIWPTLAGWGFTVISGYFVVKGVKTYVENKKE